MRSIAFQNTDPCYVQSLNSKFPCIIFRKEHGSQCIPIGTNRFLEQVDAPLLSNATLTKETAENLLTSILVKKSSQPDPSTEWLIARSVPMKTPNFILAVDWVGQSRQSIVDRVCFIPIQQRDYICPIQLICR